MIPPTKDLWIYQGDTFELTFRLRQTAAVNSAYFDLTDSELKAQIRVSEYSSTVNAEFTVTVADQVDFPGQATISLTPTQTRTVVDGGVWDLQVTFPDTTVHTYMRGAVHQIKEVTR